MDRECNIIAENGCEQKIFNIKSKITEENLINISNKGIYKRGLKDAETVEKAEISYSDEFLKIKFNDIEALIKDNLTGVSCSCQSKTICRHIITALIILSECQVNTENIETEEIIDISDDELPQENIQPEPEKSIEINSGYLNEVIKFIDSVIKKGIINCNESDIDTSLQLSLKSENTVHNNISLMLRSLSSDIQNMIDKSTEFVSVNTFHLVSRIYNTVKAVLNNSDSYEALKVLCTDTSSGGYEERGILNFIGLGAYPWSTKSGYTGITSFLYCTEDNEIYTYSSSLAYIHEKTKDFDDIDSLSKSFKNHEHWQNYASMMSISGSSFKLFNCKTNSLNRISSSKSIVMNVSGFTLKNDVEKLNLSAERFLNETYEYDYFSVKQSEKICVVYADRFADVFYNKATQVLEFAISDGNNFYPCEISWTNQNKNAISYIETISKRGIAKGKMFICRYINERFIPISVVNENGIKSFYFD